MTGRVNRRGWIVLESVASHDGGLCVDFFQDPSGGFGYELFRSDNEGQTGWLPIGGFGATRFDSPIDAVHSAIGDVAFLSTERRPAEAVVAWVAHLRPEGKGEAPTS